MDQKFIKRSLHLLLSDYDNHYHQLQRVTIMTALEKQRLIDLPPISIDGLELNAQRYEAYYQHRRMDLTLTEFKIFYTLVRKPGYVCTRRHLLDLISRDLKLVDRNIDVHVSSLRKKLKEGRAHIETVRGLGYRYNIHIRSGLALVDNLATASNP